MTRKRKGSAFKRFARTVRSELTHLKKGMKKSFRFDVYNKPVKW